MSDLETKLIDRMALVKIIEQRTKERDMLLDALKRILRTAAPEWEIESGMPGYDLACYNARMVIKEVMAAKK